MAQLRQDYAQFIERDAEILVVWPDDAKTVQDYCQKEKLPFVNLVDPGHEVANQYGQQTKILKLGRMPALVVLDRDGTVQYEHKANSMSDIPSNKTVLDVLDSLNIEWKTATSGELALP
jgi:peroxiredoxin Q/BCP